MSDALHWYRGSLHLHSFWSDGNDLPEIIAARFRQNGYQFIAFTEHDRLQAGDCWIPTDPETPQGRVLHQDYRLAWYRQRLGDGWITTREVDGRQELRLRPLAEYRSLVEDPGEFLMLDGQEITARWKGGTHWLNGIHVPEVVGPVVVEGGSPAALQRTVAEATRVAQAAGRTAVTILNHPNYEWNVTAEDIAASRSLAFLEIHTALEDTHTYGDNRRAGAERIWDVALSLRLSRPDSLPIYGVAADDAHDYHGNTLAGPFRAWVMVRAPCLDADALMQAMTRGDFYASTGVRLRELAVSPRELALRIEPEPGAQYVTRFIGTRQNVSLETATHVVGDDGRILRTTQRYMDEVGVVLKEEHGLEASYRLKGDELYVRALVESDSPHPCPTVPGDVKKAWTQPATGRR